MLSKLKVYVIMKLLCRPTFHCCSETLPLKIKTRRCYSQRDFEKNIQNKWQLWRVSSWRHKQLCYEILLTKKDVFCKHIHPLFLFLKSRPNKLMNSDICSSTRRKFQTCFRYWNGNMWTTDEDDDGHTYWPTVNQEVFSQDQVKF